MATTSTPSPTAPSFVILSTQSEAHLQPSRPKLRSCLSPSPRCSTSTSDPYTPDLSLAGSSRSASFSSIVTAVSLASGSTDSTWRRCKSVRWEGEDEGLSVPVKAYHETWSALEYDRSPLAPPSEAERTCVLPERNSRCLRTAIDCWIAPVLDDGDMVESPVDTTREGVSFPFFPPTGFSLTTSQRIEEEEEEDDDESDSLTEEQEAEDDSDRLPEAAEWEECMERRRMMFSMMCRSSPPKGDGQGAAGEDGQEDRPEFEGFRSLSARLFDLLRSVGCEDASARVAAEEVSADVREGRTSLDLAQLDRLDVSGSHLGLGNQSTPSLSSAESSDVGESESPAAPLMVDLVPVAMHPSSDLGVLTLPAKMDEFNTHTVTQVVSAASRYL